MSAKPIVSGQPVAMAPAQSGVRLSGVAGTAVRWLLYAVVVAVFAGPYWAMIATAFNADTVQPGQLQLWPSHPSRVRIEMRTNHALRLITAGFVLTGLSACSSSSPVRPRPV